ncbi:MAG TPA: DUF222 domain-containing protein [Jiangellaceae bacterium]|nr:DUF222 domain-containing protein [Jiangellaceae bacterium]
MNQQYTGLYAHPAVSAIGAAEAELVSSRDAAYVGLSDDELEAAVEGCERLRSYVYGLELALVADADARDLGRRLGAASTAAWLAGRFRMRPGRARSLVQVANRSHADDEPVDFAANVRSAATGRELRATAAALAEGVISPDHVVVVGKVMERVPVAVSVEEAQRAESQLAEFCEQHDPSTVAKLGEYMLALMSADTLEELEAERHRARELRFDEVTGRVTGRLTSEGLALVRTALDPLAAPVPAADGERDPRSPGQRSADALVELARRAIAADSFETNHGISHRVVVTVGLDALAGGHEHEGGQLLMRAVGGDGASAPFRVAGQNAPGDVLWGGLISPSTARRIACCAGIQRVVLDPNGAVLDVGREFRTATPAQFAALNARDGGCAFPGCTRPASWCIAHHIEHWADGGETNLDNLVLLCTHHHTVVHHHGWDVQLGPDRLPDFFPPPWVDPDREPRRNRRPRFGRGAPVRNK